VKHWSLNQLSTKIASVFIRLGYLLFPPYSAKLLGVLSASSPTLCNACGNRSRSLELGLCRTCRDLRFKEDNRAKAKTAITSLLDRDDVLILDTETNGVGQTSEVIEVSVINTKGDVLLDTLLKPKYMTMNPFAERVHGINLKMLKDAPGWSEVFPELARLADRRTILAWNASFDSGVLAQTSTIWNLEPPRWLFVCAMRLYAKKRGIKLRGLHKSVVDEGLAHLLETYQSHRALGDVKFVLEVLRATSAHE
jgi:DNA polymerase III subunit epsilon